MKLDFEVQANFSHLTIALINSYVTFLFQTEMDTINLTEMRIHTLRNMVIRNKFLPMMKGEHFSEKQLGLQTSLGILKAGSQGGYLGLP